MVTSFASESLRALRRLLRGPGPAPAHAGRLRVLDGLSAVALVEALIDDAAGLGASYPASLAARVWDAQQQATGLNSRSLPLSGIETDGPRKALASATGASLAGRRATAFLAGPDLLECRDLIADAAGKHAPLVIHAVLRAAGGHAEALGSGHEGLHALANTGCIRLVATNVQEAVDAAVVGRRVAELSLRPVIVAMDCDETALAAQSVALPDKDLLRAYLSSPDDLLPPPTKAQRAIFGDVRRRVPRRYDLDQPVLLGALQGPEAWALGAAAGAFYFAQEQVRLLDEALEQFAAQTGRHLAPIRLHRTNDAQIVLVTQGSSFEIAVTAADLARKEAALKVGVVGIARLEPLDERTLAASLQGVRVACVLERTPVSPGTDGPLSQHVRAVLDRCRENAAYGGSIHPGLPPLSSKDAPRLVTAVAGIGGLPIRTADLTALLDQLREPRRPLYYVGLEFVRRESQFPKHQALLDALNRDFPEAAGLGVRAPSAQQASSERAFCTVGVLRQAGMQTRSLAADLASLAHGVVGHGLRSRPAIGWQRSDHPSVDRVTLGPDALLDPGDDTPLDVLVLSEPGVASPAAIDGRVPPGASLVALEPVLHDERTGALVSMFARNQRFVFSIPDREEAEGPLCYEALLGGSLRVLLERLGKGGTPASQLRQKREEMLADAPEADRDARLAAFVHGFESAEAIPPAAASCHPAVSEQRPAIPPELSALKGSGASSLPRFWDHSAVFYRNGRTAEMIADPTASMATTPPLSSALRMVGGAADVLPLFDPLSCDGAPELWTTCPDGSIAALALTPRQLLDAGIDLATRAGEAADALRPLAAQLSKRASKIAAADAPPTTAGELLATALDDVLAKLDAPEDRKGEIRKAFDAVVRQIGALPIAVTRPFFLDAERSAPGSGALLCVVVNPDACKSPELLLKRCEGRGLRAAPRTDESVAAARALWKLWQRLPDTPGDVIERVRRDDRVGPLAAIMLSRHCLHAMVHGDGAEPASGAKLALRQVLAIAEYHYQPRIQNLLVEIDSLRSKLSERVQGLLAAALPTADLDALGRGLEALGGGDVELSALSARIDSAVVDGHVDGEALSRLVETARGLADLQWKLREGQTGAGRSRLGLVIASGAAAHWSAAFPYNPFLAPVVVDQCAEAGALARGVLEAHLRDAIELFKLLRLARIELDRPAEAPHAARALRSLRFSDLTQEERELVPPIFVVGDGGAFGGRGLSDLVWLLNSGLPAKLVVLNEIGGRADGALSLDALGAYPPPQRYDIGLLATLTRRAFVAQTTLADTRHFYESVERALAAQVPALIHIHAPSPERHGFEQGDLTRQAESALRSRAWPIFTFDPGEAGVFGSCLDISANPEAGHTWTLDDEGRPLTPLDWASTESRFSHQFTPLASDAPAPTPAAEYLLMDAGSRQKRTPYVETAFGGSRVKLAVGERLLHDALDRVRLWRTLEELAGEVTPFTAKVQREAQDALAAAHQRELAAVRDEMESRLAELRAQFEADTTEQVASRLLALAGYDGEGPE